MEFIFKLVSNFNKSCHLHSITFFMKAQQYFNNTEIKGFISIPSCWNI